MSSQSEIGHARNVSQFQLLVSHCESLGAEYNPANPAISLPGLQAKLAEAHAALQNLNGIKTSYDNATNAREIAFTGLASFGTRVTNALAASGAATQTVADAQTVLRKLRGTTRAKKPPVAAAAPVVPGEAAPVDPAAAPAVSRTVSTSQRSFDQQASHFARLVAVVSAEPLYTPNEAELAVAGLQTRLDGLNAAIADAQHGIVAYESALIARNASLYAVDTGLVAISGDVKKYIKSLYGAGSPNYKNVSAIAIRKIA